MTRRAWLHSALAASASATGSRHGYSALPQAAPSQARRRNIVFILADDHRHDFIGALGHPWLQGKTPNMDRMIHSGLRFANAFVTTSLCSPSRASILTSQYVFRHGVINNSTPLPTALPTFPFVLQQQGYRTAFIGKWHMGGDGEAPQPGFDHWFSFRGQGVYTNPTVSRNGERVEMQGYMADILTAEAVAFLREAKDRPFCLYLSHKNVHGPFEPAPRHKGMFRDKEIPYPETFADIPENTAGKPDWFVRQRNSWHGSEGAMAQPGGFERMYRGYCEGLLSVDDSIGRVREELERLGIANETLLVYMGDNGYLHGEHGLIDKRVMHEPSIRVPLLMECPGLIPQAFTARELVTNVDIAPTMLELAGVPVPDNFQGRSLVPLIQRKPVEWREDFVYVYYWEREAPQTPTILGLRTERYSLMHYHGVWDRYELYDIQADPHQKRNLLGHIYNGMKYGPLEQYIQDPELRALHAGLQKRLYAELQRLGSRHLPTWRAD